MRLLAGPWRPEFEGLVAGARRSLLLAAPFIKRDEADRVCAALDPEVEVTTLANLEVGSVAAAALDIAALVRLAQATPQARVVALSNLHAKVYVADDAAAIVTSGNLTRSGLDSNLEYGVLLRERSAVRRVRNDLLSFARLGATAEAKALSALIPLETDLREAHTGIEKRTASEARRRFADAVREAKPRFGAIQVGQRTAHAVFAEAILLVLRRGPRRTKEIHEEVQALLPALCDDTDILFIRGERYGRAWKRRLRHAQQHLDRKGLIAYDASTQTWGLTEAAPTGTTPPGTDPPGPAPSG